MNDIGISAGYNYALSASSIYKINQVSPVENKQEISSAPPPKAPQSSEINDEAIISDEAKALLESEQNAKSDELSKNDKSNSLDGEKPKFDTSKLQEDLSAEQKQQLVELKARDMEVKAHEQAHIAAAAGISASAPSYDYQVGPDGKKYAVGGEVNLSFVQSGDPKSDIANAQAMKAAALAPAQPSSQDKAVARSAEAMISEAKQQLADLQKEEIKEVSEKSGETKSTKESEITGDSKVTEQIPTESNSEETIGTVS